MLTILDICILYYYIYYIIYHASGFSKADDTRYMYIIYSVLLIAINVLFILINITFIMFEFV